MNCKMAVLPITSYITFDYQSFKTTYLLWLCPYMRLFLGESYAQMFCILALHKLWSLILCLETCSRVSSLRMCIDGLLDVTCFDTILNIFHCAQTGMYCTGLSELLQLICFVFR